MTTDERTTVFDGLAGEITQHHPRGHVLIAIDGVDSQETAEFGDSLAEALRTGGRDVYRAASAADPATEERDPVFPRYENYRADDDYRRLRDIVSQFREGVLLTSISEGVVPADAMLIADGRFLLRPELRGVWHYRVWLEGDTHLSEDSLTAQVRYTRDSAPRAAADAIFDVTKAEAPVRVWADSC